MYHNTTASYNTAVGYQSLWKTTGQQNTATGSNSLLNNSTGAQNTAFGYNAGDIITTGSQNVLLGYGADPSANNASNQIVIGYNAIGAGNKIVQLGNTSITNVKTSGTITAGAITIPNTDGINGQVLQTNGSGILSWATASGGANSINGLTDGKSYSNGSSIFLGQSAGTNDDGTNNNNVGIGFNALLSNTSGNDNTAMGIQHLKAKLQVEKILLWVEMRLLETLPDLKISLLVKLRFLIIP
ncbi:MAG: hypothetical protein QM485_09585 [Flavobacteriaceae bacterium]